MVFPDDVFKDNQKDVEMATETLSEYLERDISSENLSCIKQKVQDKYRYDNKSRLIYDLRSLYKLHVHDWSKSITCVLESFECSIDYGARKTCIVHSKCLQILHKAMK